MPSPGNRPDPRVEPMYFMSPTLAGGFFTAIATWEATSHTVLELKVLKSASDFVPVLFRGLQSSSGKV